MSASVHTLSLFFKGSFPQKNLLQIIIPTLNLLIWNLCLFHVICKYYINTLLILLFVFIMIHSLGKYVWIVFNMINWPTTSPRLLWRVTRAMLLKGVHIATKICPVDSVSSSLPVWSRSLLHGVIHSYRLQIKMAGGSWEPNSPSLCHSYGNTAVCCGYEMLPCQWPSTFCRPSFWNVHFLRFLWKRDSKHVGL